MPLCLPPPYCFPPIHFAPEPLALADAGFLHSLDQEDNAVTLAKPPDQITADALIEIGFRMVDEGIAEKRPALLERLREAQRDVSSATFRAVLACDASKRSATTSMTMRTHAGSPSSSRGWASTSTTSRSPPP